MPRGWPPLTDREVVSILTALGFSYSHSKGGHDFYKGHHNGKNCTVTVSAHSSPFGADLLQFMAKQANSNRKEFYGATPATAAKIT